MESNPSNSYRTVGHTLNEKPFVLELAGTSDPPPGSQTPKSHGVAITPALRTSGLLFSLPAQELKNLIYLLSFATAYGLGRPTAQQLAHAMQVSETRVRARMDRLTRFLWNGKHLAYPVRRMDGQDAYAVSKDILVFIEPLPGSEGKSQQPVAEDQQPMTVKDVIIARSRAKYTRPREEVERSVAQQMGWPIPGTTAMAGEKAPPDTPNAQLRRRLIETGVVPRVADELIDRYPKEAIQQQLDWLPYRKAKDPARLLVAAIEGDYSKPLALKRRSPFPADKSNS